MNDYDAHYVCPDCSTKIFIVDDTLPKHTCAMSKIRAIATLSTPQLLSYADYVAASDNTVSKEEYDRYCVLYDYAQRGIIQKLELQIKYVVQPRIKIKPARKWYKGFTQSRVTYSPDFRYQYDGITIVEEYKAVYKPKKPKRAKPPTRKTQDLYPLITDASRKSIKELIAHNKAFVQGDAIFVIVGWYKAHQRFYAFNANKKQFEYPLANYIELVAVDKRKDAA